MNYHNSSQFDRNIPINEMKTEEKSMTHTRSTKTRYLEKPKFSLNSYH